MKYKIILDFDETDTSLQEIIDELEKYASFEGLQVYRIGINIQQMVYPKDGPIENRTI